LRLGSISDSNQMSRIARTRENHASLNDCTGAWVPSSVVVPDAVNALRSNGMTGHHETVHSDLSTGNLAGRTLIDLIESISDDPHQTL
jgi:hypothetical protein